MSIVEESITFKLNRLSQTWTETWMNFINRKDVGKIVDGFTSISEILGTIIDKLGVAGSIGFGAGLFASIKNFGKPEMQGFNKIVLNMPKPLIVLPDTAV